ncbi:MAG TPA: hypothetical protein VGE08_16050 [Steroidobacter sp.]|uniref:hypothetical protein n=1 Tax=Steroidobacter sp. TaxID=1978227 RepID=UPI002ED8900E
MSPPSPAMRCTLPLICLSLIVSVALAAEEPAGAREAGTLSEAVAAAGPAVDTSKTTITRSSAGDPQPSAQPSTTSQRAGGPQAVVRSDRLELDTTVVTGNRELPKVLYIVPWKKSDLGDLPAQPFNTLLDEALTPVDRDVFRREVTYYGAIAAQGGGGADGPPSPAERSEK